MLAAMTEVVCERGAANATVAHVVERAGVSRRTFYELFGDCEACFLGAFDEAISRLSRYVLDTYDPDAEWATRVRAALIALLEFLDMERGAGRLLLVGSLGAGTAALERRRHVLARIIALVDEGRELVKKGQEPPVLTAEGIVGGVLSVLHARLLDPGDESLLSLAGPLMSAIVLPYLGVSVARREIERPVAKRRSPEHAVHLGPNPLMGMEMRLTYRTVRVLMAIAAQPGSSNRVVAQVAEVTDQGQMSKLLARLSGIGLIENTGAGPARGEPNAWTLTEKGWRMQAAIAEQATRE